MKPHIQQTIEELSARISALQDLIRGLQGEFGESNKVRSAEEKILAAGAAGWPPLEQAAVPVQVKHRGRAMEPRPGKLTSAQAIDQLPEPITPEKIISATGLSRQGAWAAITRGVKRNELFRIDPGVYRRGAGQNLTRVRSDSVVAPVAVAPGTEVTVNQKHEAAILREEIKSTCKARDRHREAGNDKLEQIAQQQIDRLEKKLETLEGK